MCPDNETNPPYHTRLYRLLLRRTGQSVRSGKHPGGYATQSQSRSSQSDHHGDLDDLPGHRAVSKLYDTSGRLYVLDEVNPSRIHVFEDSNLILQWNLKETAQDIAVDNQGNLFIVSDTKVYKYAR